MTIIDLQSKRTEREHRNYCHPSGISGEIDARVTHSNGTEMVRVNDRWYVASEVRLTTGQP